MRQRIISDNQKNRMKELRAGGTSLQKIADQYGVSKTIVARYVKGISVPEKPDPDKNRIYFSWKGYYHKCRLGV